MSQNKVSKIYELSDGLLVQIDIDEDKFSPASSTLFPKLDSSLEKLADIFAKLTEPVKKSLNKIEEDVEIEKAEIELGLSFEAGGSLFIANSKAGANLRVKLVLVPKKSNS